MRKMIGILSLLLACALTGCGGEGKAGDSRASELKVTACEAVDTAGTGFYTAEFAPAGGAVAVKSVEGGSTKLEIPIAYDPCQVYCSMWDENCGSILYCSSPAAGQMKKILFYTEDGWKSCTETDISGRLDGYPNSLTMRSGQTGYIGAELRSDAYLYRTDDAGQTWEPYTADTSVDNCNGYAPVFDGEKACLILDLKSDAGYVFRLYCSGDGGETWENAGDFSLEEGLDRYFLKDGSLYLVDEKGGYWQLAGITGTD